MLTVSNERFNESLKYEGTQVIKVNKPQLKLKCTMIIAHTAGDVMILNQGIY